MTGFENLCMNCMSDTAGKSECPHCGCQSGGVQEPYALPVGTVLQDRYIVGSAKSSNGEGTLYIGYDTVLHIPVELREFFPQAICERADGSTEIRVKAGSELAFSQYLADFLSFSREVAHLRELTPIIQSYDIFEENHTAYTVSEWEESITLRYFIERSGGSLGWNEARPLFMPVLSALSTMHAAKINHLGISPDTLCIMKDGKMKLGGFCIPAVRRADTELPMHLVPGCAAIEQYVVGYAPDEATDVYGFAASIFFALTGELPQDALKRRTDARLLISTSILRTIPPHVVTALANALQVMPDQRTATFERLRAELSAAPTITATIEDPEVLLHASSSYPEKKKSGAPAAAWVLIPCALALVLFTAIGVFWLSNGGMVPMQSGANSSSNASGPAEASSSIPSESPAMAPLASSIPAENTGELIEVPTLIGQNYAALTETTSSGGEYQILRSSEQFNDEVPEGEIISQSPAPGEMVEYGTSIVVVVSKGAEMRKLPSIFGMTLAEASTTVTAAGFVPTKTEAYSDVVEAGLTIGYQNKSEGDLLAYGSQVVIIISSGPQKDELEPSSSSEKDSSVGTEGQTAPRMSE